ncbi:hypothetical protein PR202_ga29802 [Eleusine coracana subsp. coracana]|uniref:Uncharacterized protein n=1 Tax=Eleusine coracana subsp. coracana TaxID=191504 RepID=A0AAV5DN43_ELECO|nr:hypothetical protein PR202_ga29802 [Eleusine coracana subsp. coracana]
MRSNTGERWIQDRVDRYGPVSKLSLFGTPTVLVTGPVANKFILSNISLSVIFSLYSNNRVVMLNMAELYSETVLKSCNLKCSQS